MELSFFHIEMSFFQIDLVLHLIVREKAALVAFKNFRFCIVVVFKSNKRENLKTKERMTVFGFTIAAK